jgi:hypothetical protein
MRRLAIAAVALLAAGCGGSAPTPSSLGASPPLGSARPLGSATLLAVCAIPPDTYADLAACHGTADEFDLQLAKMSDGKTVARVAIASKDPQEILAGMGAYTAAHDTTAGSFTVFAFGSERDYKRGAGYNRGRIFWNNGGPITVDVCTAWEKPGNVDICTDELHFTVTNQ